MEARCQGQSDDNTTDLSTPYNFCQNKCCHSKKFLNEQSTLLEEYDEQLVRRLIEKITVYDDKLTIEIKSGVEVDV